MKDKPKEEWEKKFDKLRIYYPKVRVVEPLCLSEEQEKVIKAFIYSFLKQERHDHEILVKTILETKNKEIKQERKKVLEEVESEIKTNKSGTLLCGGDDEFVVVSSLIELLQSLKEEK